MCLSGFKIEVRWNSNNIASIKKFRSTNELLRFEGFRNTDYLEIKQNCIVYDFLKF